MDWAFVQQPVGYMCVPTCYVESKCINSGHETKDIGNIGLSNCKQDSSLQKPYKLGGS